MAASTMEREETTVRDLFARVDEVLHVAHSIEVERPQDAARLVHVWIADAALDAANIRLPDARSLKEPALRHATGHHRVAELQSELDRRGVKTRRSTRKDGAMSDRANQLAAFMAEYERAANSHDVGRVLPLIAEDATYWFTDGSYRGQEEIAGALERTFATIHGEVYGIRELEWVALTDELAACRYHFFWQGVVDGQPRSGRGRGTNVLVRRDGAWRVQHEHLSY
jgi:uncharacterized protein (TIGR02246 family)